MLKEIENSLNPKGKIDCKTVFNLSKKEKKSIKYVMQFVESKNIKIDNCQFGFFGKKVKSDINLSELEIVENLNLEREINCSKAQRISNKNSIDREVMGVALNRLNIQAKKCILGCF